mmetsp:Transcript_11564/g.17455  ORF Transcript_11564/g.17455 Transcript_11564/m.17455 type:complete len:134 (+) Transcript_11564:550-951(+)
MIAKKRQEASSRSPSGPNSSKMSRSSEEAKLGSVIVHQKDKFFFSPAQFDTEETKAFVDQLIDKQQSRELVGLSLVKKQDSDECRVQEGLIDINFKITDDGITPLMLACTSGNIDIVKLILLNPGLNIDQKDY